MTTELRYTMNPRENNLLWLSDMLDHLAGCRSNLESAGDRQTVEVITDMMMRDLDCCRRLCETIRRRTAVLQAA